MKVVVASKLGDKNVPTTADILGSLNLNAGSSPTPNALRPMMGLGAAPASSAAGPPVPVAATKVYEPSPFADKPLGKIHTPKAHSTPTAKMKAMAVDDAVGTDHDDQVKPDKTHAKQKSGKTDGKVSNSAVSTETNEYEPWETDDTKLRGAAAETAMRMALIELGLNQTPTSGPLPGIPRSSAAGGTTTSENTTGRHIGPGGVHFDTMSPLPGPLPGKSHLGGKESPLVPKSLMSPSLPESASKANLKPAPTASVLPRHSVGQDLDGVNDGFAGTHAETGVIGSSPSPIRTGPPQLKGKGLKRVVRTGKDRVWSNADVVLERMTTSRESLGHSALVVSANAQGSLTETLGTRSGLQPYKQVQPKLGRVNSYLGMSPSRENSKANLNLSQSPNTSGMNSGWDIGTGTGRTGSGHHRHGDVGSPANMRMDGNLNDTTAYGSPPPGSGGLAGPLTGGPGTIPANYFSPNTPYSRTSAGGSATRSGTSAQSWPWTSGGAGRMDVFEEMGFGPSRQLPQGPLLSTSLRAEQRVRATKAQPKETDTSDTAPIIPQKYGTKGQLNRTKGGSEFRMPPMRLLPASLAPKIKSRRTKSQAANRSGRNSALAGMLGGSPGAGYMSLSRGDGHDPHGPAHGRKSAPPTIGGTGNYGYGASRGMGMAPTAYDRNDDVDSDDEAETKARMLARGHWNPVDSKGWASFDSINETLRQYAKEKQKGIQRKLVKDREIKEIESSSDVFQWLVKRRKKVRSMASEEERENFDRVFHFLDDDDGGTVSIDELQRAMQILGIKGLKKSDLEDMMNLVDPQQTGELDFNQFMLFMMNDAVTEAAARSGASGAIENFPLLVNAHSVRRDVALLIFKLIDEDGGGSLDMEELLGAFKQLGLSFTEEQIARAVKEADTGGPGDSGGGGDGDGEIDFEEFVSLLQYLSDLEAARVAQELEDNGGVAAAPRVVPTASM